MDYVIFLPGFYGSELVLPKSKRLLWISAREAVVGSRTLARTGLGVPGAVTLATGHVLERVPIVSNLLGIDVYGKFLTELRNHLARAPSRVELLLFPYDWRQDYSAAVSDFADLIQTIKEKDAHRITVIAHSMGGLILSYYLRYGRQEPETAVENWEGAESINAVVLASVPYQGSLTALYNMMHGAKFGLNTALVNADAFCTFPSVYQLLPSYSPVLLNDQLEPMSQELTDPTFWQNRHWGFLRKKTNRSKELLEFRLRFVTEMLGKASALIARLHALVRAPASAHPRLMHIYCRSHPTIARTVLIGDGDSSELVFDKASFRSRFPTNAYGQLISDGDQTVTVASAQLPEPYRSQCSLSTVFESKAIHSEVFNDLSVRAQIFDFLEPE